MSTQQFNRPNTASPEAGEAGLPNRDKFQAVSATRPRIPIGSEDIDSELNVLIDAVNELFDTAIAGVLPDKSVTIAKHADGTDGELLTWDSSGVATTVPVGTAGNVLTSNGAGTEPTFQAAPGTPSGMVSPYAGSSSPSGWLFCDGTAVSRATYSDLFTVVSTTYGVGDGSTTFNVPDLRGRTVIAQDNMGGTSADRITDSQADVLGGSGGAETVISAGSIVTTLSGSSNSYTLLEADIPAHTHDITAYSNSTHGGAFVQNSLGTAATQTAVTESTGGDGGHSHGLSGGVATSTFTGSLTSVEQPWLALNYIIKT